MADREETGEDDLESRLRQVASCARYDNKTIFEAADRLKLYRDRICELESGRDALREENAALREELGDVRNGIVP